MTRRIGIAAAPLIAALLSSVALAATEAPEAHNAEAGGSWLMLLFFTINFALFVFVLVYYAMPMARGFFADRAKGIRSNLDRLDSSLREAEQYAARAKAGLDSLESDVAQRVRDLETETQFQITRIQEAARAAAERMRRDTELTANAISGSARRRLREELAATAARMARELIASQMDATDQSRLIDSFAERLRQEAAAR